MANTSGRRGRRRRNWSVRAAGSRNCRFAGHHELISRQLPAWRLAFPESDDSGVIY